MLHKSTYNDNFPNNKFVACLNFFSTGDVERYESGDDDNFSQPGILYRDVFNAEQKQRLAENIAGSLSKAQKFIQDRAIQNFSQVFIFFKSS